MSRIGGQDGMSRVGGQDAPGIVNRSSLTNSRCGHLDICVTDRSNGRICFDENRFSPEQRYDGINMLPELSHEINQWYCGGYTCYHSRYGENNSCHCQVSNRMANGSFLSRGGLDPTNDNQLMSFYAEFSSHILRRRLYFIGKRKKKSSMGIKFLRMVVCLIIYYK